MGGEHNEENHPNGRGREGSHVVLVGAGRQAWPVLVPVVWWLGATVAASQPVGTATYRQLVDQLELTDLLALGPAYMPDLQLKLRVRPRNRERARLVNELRGVDRAGTRVYPLDRYGAVELPLSQALYETNPTLFFPDGVQAEFAAQVRLSLDAKGVRSIPAAAIERALRQYAAAAAAAGWRYWLSAPKWASVVVRMAAQQGGCQIVGGRRRTVVLPQDGRGQVRIELPHIWTGEQRRIECDAPVEEVLLEWRPA